MDLIEDLVIKECHLKHDYKDIIVFSWYWVIFTVLLKVTHSDSGLCLIPK